jgi:hypothetical protein
MQTVRAAGALRSSTARAQRLGRLLVGAILLTPAAFHVASAQGATVLDRLMGSWSGSGQIRYDDGQSEGIRCSAYYSGSGDRLRLAIRCRSDSTEVEIRGLLTRQGEKLAGTWEERTFNASGEASGRVAGDKMSLSIAGGAFSGSMTVAYAGSRQVVTISTQGIRMRSVNVTLAKG